MSIEQAINILLQVIEKNSVSLMGADIITVANAVQVAASYKEPAAPSDEQSSASSAKSPN